MADMRKGQSDRLIGNEFQEIEAVFVGSGSGSVCRNIDVGQGLLLFIKYMSRNHRILTTAKRTDGE